MLGSNLLDLLFRYPSLNKLLMDSSEVSSNEAVSLEQVLELVKEPVRAVSDEALQIFNIREMQDVRTTTNTIGLPDYLSCSIPECQYTIKSS